MKITTNINTQQKKYKRTEELFTMKFLNYLLLSEFVIPALSLVLQNQPHEPTQLNQKELLHATAHGIFRSILDNREFDSTFVKFSEWESPSGELFVVPTTEESEDSNFAALGLGYRFIRDDNTVVSSSDIGNVVKIEEKNISAAGFPFGWLKHDNPTADDFFPFGSKKFMMIGVNKNSIEEIDETESMNAEGDEGEAEDETITNFGLFHWFEDEDDCDADEKTNKLFGTDHFLFVGVGSVGSGPQMEKRDVDISTSIMTIYTTTTVTSVHGVTVTQTANPNETHEENWKTSPIATTTHSHANEGNERHEDKGSGNTEDAISTKSEHLVFTTSSITNEDSQKQITGTEGAPTLLPETPSENWISETITSTHEIEEKPSETLGDFASETTVWTSPESWNSYPFSTTETEYVEQPAASSFLTFENATSHVISSSAKPLSTFSSFEQFHTSSFYKNRTESSVSSKKLDESIYTRTKVTNVSKVTTSENIAHSQGGYWVSIFGLILAVFSGVILI